MLEFLIDDIFVIFGGRIFHQTVGIPMGTKLCSSSGRLVPVFLINRLHTGASQEKRKTASVFRP
jgi:hypothetical protein